MKLTIMFLTLTGMALAALPSIWDMTPLVVYNSSQSMPKGIYRSVAGSFRKGDIVLVRQSGDLLLKRLSAEEGDFVCRKGLWITINGRVVATAMSNDGHGRRLPDWQGCQLLKTHEVFVLGEHPKSFDSRYFGVLQRGDLIGKVKHCCCIRKTVS